MTIEIYRDSKGDHRWRMKSANGKTVADSAEGYNRREGAVKALVRIIGGVKADGFNRMKVRITAKGGDPVSMERDKKVIMKALGYPYYPYC